MLTLAQRNEVYERVEHFINLGNDIFNTDVIKPYVLFTKRGTCGGTADSTKNELNFNAGLMVENWDEYMNQTIPHEVAHLIKNHIYGYGRGKGPNSSHGANWQKVMRNLGVEPTRTHSMDTSSVKQHKAPIDKFVYVCEGCQKELILTKIRHNRMARGQRSYSHCRGTKLVHKESLGRMTYAEAHDRKVPGFVAEAAKKAKAKKPAAKKAYVLNPNTIIGKAVLAVKQGQAQTPPYTRSEMINALADLLSVNTKRAGQIYADAKKKAA